MEQEKGNHGLLQQLSSFAARNGRNFARRIGMVLCVILALTAESQAISGVAWSIYGCMFSGEWLVGSLASGGKENRTYALFSGIILVVCLVYFFINVRLL